MNMHKVLINIVIARFIITRVQSYDIFLNVVRVAYGKNANKKKSEIVENQPVK
jgi:hypothetical protein